MPSFLTRFAIALALIAAEAIVASHLAGRRLPMRLHCAVVGEVRRRLVEGAVPVVDRAIRQTIETGGIDGRVDLKVLSVG